MELLSGRSIRRGSNVGPVIAFLLATYGKAHTHSPSARVWPDWHSRASTSSWSPDGRRLSYDAWVAHPAVATRHTSRAEGIAQGPGFARFLGKQAVLTALGGTRLQPARCPRSGGTADW